VIVGVCADKGSPGASTLATALAMAWSGRRALLEADPSGGDAVFRARQVDGQAFLSPEPSVLTLAADSRVGIPQGRFADYAQDTGWGIPVIPGAAGAAAFSPMRQLWPAVAAEAARWDGVAFADLGRLQAGGPAMPVAKAAHALLVVSRLSVEDLYHLRERVTDLAATVGDPTLPRHPLAVVVSTPRKDATAAVRQVSRMLESVGSPIPVLGAFHQDDPAAADLRRGAASRRVTGGVMLASAATLCSEILRRWPELGSGTRSADRPAVEVTTAPRNGKAPVVDRESDLDREGTSQERAAWAWLGTGTS
jgi:hypothetical protein